MRISKEQLKAQRENSRLRDAGEWFFTGWYRLVGPDGMILLETSNPRDIANLDDNDINIPLGSKVERLYEKRKWRWR